MKRVLAALRVALGAAIVCGMMVTFSCMEMFYSGRSDHFSMDAVSHWRCPSLFSSVPLVNNIILLLLFCFAHSLLARDWLKGLISSIMSPSTYRQLYIVMSTLFFFLICYGWSPQPNLVWNIEWLPARFILKSVAALGLTLISLSLFSLKPLEFFGIQEHLDKLRGTSTTESNNLVVSGAYGYVRHPMYTGLLIALWMQPTMSEGRLLYCVALTLYVLLATPYLEEPNLIKHFGQKYKSYMESTPMIFPLPSTWNKKSAYRCLY